MYQLLTGVNFPPWSQPNVPTDLNYFLLTDVHLNPDAESFDQDLMEVNHSSLSNTDLSVLRENETFEWGVEVTGERLKLRYRC